MRKILITICLLSTLLMLSPVAFAQQGFTNPSETNPGAGTTEADRDGFLNDTTIEILNKFRIESGFRTFEGNSNRNAINKPGLDSISGIIFTIIDIMKYVVGTLVVGSIIFSIVRLVSAGTEKTEEEYGKLKTNILYSVVAAIVLISMEFFFTSVFVIGSQNFLENSSTAQSFALAGASELLGIVRFIQAAIGTIAVLYLVFSGFKLVANAGNEEVVASLKSHVLYASAGLVVVAVSEFVVNQVIFVNGGQTFSVENGKALIVSFTNFVAGFIALTSFISFIYAGYLYVVSGITEDNTEKVKNIFKAGVIGILVAAGAFAIVNTVIRLDSSEAPGIIQNQLDSLSG